MISKPIDLFDINLPDNKIEFQNNITLEKDEQYEFDAFDSIKTPCFPEEEKGTSILKTQSMSSQNDFLNKQIMTITMEKESKLPLFYSLDMIKEILSNNILDKKLKLKLKKEKTIENLNQYIFIRSKKKIKNKNTDLFRHILNEKRKRGKIRKKDSMIVVHDKMTPDNILKKIKSKLLNNYIIEFLNGILNLEEKKLKKIDYKYINELIRDKELNNLNKSLEMLISLDISKRYKNLDSNYNKLIIEKIKKEKKNDETIQFALNLTFMDFIELFTHKKKINDLIKFYNKKSNINCVEIEENIHGVEELFIDLVKKHDIKYATLVVFYIFNIERALEFKQKRRNKQ